MQKQEKGTGPFFGQIKSLCGALLVWLLLTCHSSPATGAPGVFQDDKVFGNKPLAASNMTAFSPVFGNILTTNPVLIPNPSPGGGPVNDASPPAPEEAPFIYPAETIYDDTNALDFLSAAGVADDSARRDMILAVIDCKAAGLWTNLVDLLAFEPRYNPRKHLSLLGRPWSFTNEVWSERGTGELRATNFISYTLPVSLTNYTLCVFYRENAAGLDSYDGTAAHNNLAELRSSADGSCTLLTTWAIWGGTRVWTSAGTNFTYWQDHLNVTSNRVDTLLSGAAGGGAVAATITPNLFCVGYSNGAISVSVNGNPAFLGLNNYVTNKLKMLANSAAVDQLLIGGGDTNWLNLGCSNTYGATIMNAMVFNCPLSRKVSACAMRMATDLEPFNEAVEFAGSSILNDQAAANGGTVGAPLTNSIAWIDEQQNSGRLVFQSASPGSRLLDWPNCNATVPATAYVPVLTYLNPAKYTIRRFITDGPRNDAFGGVPINDSVARFDKFCRPLLAQGIKVELVQTPWSYGSSAGQNQNWIETCRAVRANFPLSNFYPFADMVTSNILAAASQDFPPVHPNAKNVAGYLFNAAMDDVVNGKPPNFSPSK